MIQEVELKYEVVLAAAKMTPEDEGNDVREIVREMSRMTNRILILGIIIILAILSALIYLGILTFPFLASLVLCSS
jgi:uncharacterized membrane protein YdbT with pleckstrin-like domain